MTPRIVSGVLLAAGVGLVVAGGSVALGGTPLAAAASLAAVAALLYAGAAWGGARHAVPSAVPAIEIVVFNREGRVVSGSGAGQPVASRFPEMLRAEIDRRCRAALDGSGARFPCLLNGRLVFFEALPVRGTDGAIVYGLLLSSGADSAAAARL